MLLHDEPLPLPQKSSPVSKQVCENLDMVGWGNSSQAAGRDWVGTAGCCGQLREVSLNDAGVTWPEYDMKGLVGGLGESCAVGPHHLPSCGQLARAGDA